MGTTAQIGYVGNGKIRYINFARLDGTEVNIFNTVKNLGKPSNDKELLEVAFKAAESWGEEWVRGIPDDFNIGGWILALKDNSKFMEAYAKGQKVSIDEITDEDVIKLGAVWLNILEMDPNYKEQLKLLEAAIKEKLLEGKAETISTTDIDGLIVSYNPGQGFKYNNLDIPANSWFICGIIYDAKETEDGQITSNELSKLKGACKGNYMLAKDNGKVLGVYSLTDSIDIKNAVIGILDGKDIRDTISEATLILKK